ncbi:MAG: molecular chaperone GrpE [Chlamydiales bacterium]|jgi:molecular chaperone GrpE
MTRKKHGKHKKDEDKKENKMTEEKASDSSTIVEELAEAAHASAKAPEEITPDELTEISVRELQKIKDEAQEFKDKYWRLLAESENVRKRMQKERHELTKYALQNTIIEFLHPLDTYENAINCGDKASDEVRNWAMGFKMILDQFKEILTNHDVLSFSSEGQIFDPHHHEAVEIEETEEYPDGTIIKEFVRGYTMGEKTIRPARVKVAKLPKEANAIEETPPEEPEEGQEEQTSNNQN